jgi:alpha-1,2-mannosyltransferase
MLAALADQDKASEKLELVVYSGDKHTSPSAILDKALNQFGIHIPHDRVKFVFLQHRWLVEASTYPYFTMIGQSVGSMLLGLEALWCYNPHIFFGSIILCNLFFIICVYPFIPTSRPSN